MRASRSQGTPHLPRQGAARPGPTLPGARRRAGRALALLALLGCELAMLACRRSSEETGTRTQSPVTPATVAAPARDAGLTRAGDAATQIAAGDAAPRARPRGVYAGSAACSDCHSDEHTRWSHDWHPRALSPAEPDLVVGRFDGSHFKGDSSEAFMLHPPGQFVMRTMTRAGKMADFAVHWLIGGKRMQDMVTVLDDGRWQILPVYYHVTGRGEWVDYNESKQGQVGPDHPFFWQNFRRTANHECLDCHTTGLEVGYDRSTARFTTRFADHGVACESCHGPGARHVDTQDIADIVQPEKLDRDGELAVCAQCHGPRNPLYPILDARHHFHPGDHYDDFYQAMVVVLGPERSGDFFSDGRPRTSSFEYQGLLQSRCHRQGGATCLDCHTAPHEPSGPDELRLGPRPGEPAGPEKRPEAPASEVAAKASVTALGDGTCRGCHAPVFAQGSAHTHHRSGKGSSCVACHMPRVLSGVLDHFADHALDVPVPANTERHGVPNACGVCHAKDSPARLASQLETMWPGAHKRQERRIRLADAIDESTARDSLPALVAVMTDESEAPSLRATAAILLAQRFPDKAQRIVPVLFAARDPLLRSRAVEALSFLDVRPVADQVARLLDDPSLWVRHNAAVVLCSAGDPRGERAALSLASDPLTSGLMRPHMVIGMARARRGDLAGAEAELARAVALVPYATQALVALADVTVRRGKRDEARQHLLAALRFDPQLRGARQRLELLEHPPP